MRAALGRELRRGQVRIHQPVIAFIGHVEGGIARVSLEIEVAAVHDHAAERRRVPVEVLGRRMDDEVRAPFEGTA